MTHIKEIKFKRRLADNEAYILEVLEGHNDEINDLHFHRSNGINIQRLQRSLEYRGTLSMTPIYKIIANSLIYVYDFIKHKINVEKLLENAEEAFQEMTFWQEGKDEEFHLERGMRLLLSIKNKGEELKNKNYDKTELEKAMYQHIKELQQPNYYGCGFRQFCGMKNAKIEKIVRGLQGIVSIKAADLGYYEDLFVPRRLYKNFIKPVLENNKYLLSIEIRDKQLIEILNYIHRRTREFRKNYGNDFRPEFTRPEICREIGIKEPPINKFRKIMEPLEGIIGRIERPRFFIKEKWKSRNNIKKGYCIYYNLPSWFLPMKHQSILESEVRR